MLARWEAGLVSGALRDDFCAAGGLPLVGATVVPRASGHAGPFSRTFAFLPRFPNPSPRAFRKRVELIGRRYGFRVRSLRLLRPREFAPLLVVETDRDRKAFVTLRAMTYSHVLRPFVREAGEHFDASPHATAAHSGLRASLS